MRKASAYPGGETKTTRTQQAIHAIKHRIIFYSPLIKIYNTIQMKKTIFVLLILLFTSRVFAPSQEYAIIVAPPPIDPYKKLIYAVGMVEGKCDTLAYNAIEQATGYFQIRPIRLKDYNKRTGSNYTLKDMFDYEVAEKIFLYYAVQIGPYDFEKIARNWNGRGHKTTTYWSRIKQYI